MGRALEQVCSHRILLILGFVPASIFFMAFFAPIFNAFGFNIGESIYNLLSHICHQHFERVFFVFGHATALCSRCIGGYLGVFSAFIALIFYQKENKEAYISPPCVLCSLFFATTVTLFKSHIFSSKLFTDGCCL